MLPQQNTELWPGWETVGILGQGSFGAVYEIRRNVFDEEEKAALKVISIPQSKSELDEMYGEGYDEESILQNLEQQLKSIVSEYSLMRKLNGCSNVVHCDDVRYEKKTDGIGWNIYIKMELLNPLMKSLPLQITEDMVIRIGKEMCAALEHCNHYGIVHRDIKPQNMFLTDTGSCKLGDFGIAKTIEKTSGGTKIGTFKYMAPEVYNNQPYGSSADIYSLGLVLYWLLNERRMPFVPLPPTPVMAGTDGDAANKRLMGVPIPEPKNGSEELKRIVLKACAYDAKDRYGSATEMLRALENVERGMIPVIPVAPVSPEDTIRVRKSEPATTAVTPAEPVPETEEKKSKKGILATVLILLLLIGAGITIWVLGNQGKTSSDDAASGGNTVQTPTESENGSTEITEPTEVTEPEPTETEPSEPEPTETEPPESEPTEPEPTETEPTEPKVTEPKPTEPEKPTICVFYYNGATTYALKEDLTNTKRYMNSEKAVSQLYGSNYNLEDYRNTYGANLVRNGKVSQKSINQYMSIFSRNRLDSYPCSDWKLLVFALIYNRHINNLSWHEFELDKADVNNVLNKFFGITLNPSAGTEYYYNEYDISPIVFDGEKFCYPAASGERYDYVTIVNNMQKNPDGSYYVTYNVYFVNPGLEDSYDSLTPEEASGMSDWELRSTGQAVLVSYGNSYRVVSMTEQPA